MKNENAVCNVCTFKTCNTCPVFLQSLLNRISALETEVESLKRKNNNESEKSSIKVIRPVATLSKNIYDEDCNVWSNNLYGFIQDRIESYSLNTTPRSIINEAFTKLNRVYGYVEEQSRKDFKYNNLYSDLYSINRLLSLYYSKGPFKEIFENIIHDIISEYTKDLIPVIKDKEESSNPLIQKEKELNQKSSSRGKYNRRTKNFYKNKEEYQVAIQYYSELYNRNSKTIGVIIINILRYILSDDSLKAYDIWCNDEYTKLFNDKIVPFCDNHGDFILSLKSSNFSKISINNLISDIHNNNILNNIKKDWESK